MRNNAACKINILFAHYGEEWIRGSERCLLDLLTHLDRERFHAVVWCNSRTLAAEIKLMGITVIMGNFSVLFGWQAPRFNMVNFILLVRHGLKICREFKIDLIHANSGAPSQWLVTVARIIRKPIVAHLHAPYIFRDRLSLNLYRTTTLIGVSNAVVKPFLEDGLAPEKIKVIHNGIDIKRLDNQLSENCHDILIPPAELTLVTVGSLIRRKGVDIILHALRAVLDEGVNARLIIIGEGEESEALKNLSHQLNLSQNVAFLGERKDAQVILMETADIFISGAREEAFGLVLAEAGLAGLPVIAPAVDGIPEVVVDGETGLLVKPESIAETVKAILYLHSNPNERRRIGKNARKIIQENFSIETNVKIFEQLYGQLYNKKNRFYLTENTRLILRLLKKSLEKAFIRCYPKGLNRLFNNV